MIEGKEDEICRKKNRVKENFEKRRLFSLHMGKTMI